VKSKRWFEMLAYLIDPKLQRAHDIELPDDLMPMLEQMRELIGCDTLGGGRLSDRGDQLWCDDGVFARRSCFAFRLRNEKRRVALGPYGGICIVTGSNRHGDTSVPLIPLDMILNDIDWLGEIEPEITWIEEPDPGSGGLVIVRSVVTYKRPK
jgi:hypothetical protein